MAGSGLTGFLQNFGGGEILLIVLAALVVLGPERLPDAARSIGKGIHRLRTMTSGMQSQVQDVIDDPAMQSIRELGEFAARPRQKLAEYALEAEAEARSQAEEAERNAAAAAGSVEPTEEQPQVEAAAPSEPTEPLPDATPPEVTPPEVTAPEVATRDDTTPDDTTRDDTTRDDTTRDDTTSSAVEPGAG
jgi:sec-independent protein translocase protein TatB